MVISQLESQLQIIWILFLKKSLAITKLPHSVSILECVLFLNNPWGVFGVFLGSKTPQTQNCLRCFWYLWHRSCNLIYWPVVRRSKLWANKAWNLTWVWKWAKSTPYLHQQLSIVLPLTNHLEQLFLSYHRPHFLQVHSLPLKTQDWYPINQNVWQYHGINLDTLTARYNTTGYCKIILRL